MATFPSKVNYATGDILTATNMNEIGQAINLLDGAQLSGAKNRVLNSNFSCWQRGTSISYAASTAAYGADRWYLNVGANQASTVSRQATSDSTNLPFIQYCARIQRNSGQTGTGIIAFSQSFESVNSIPLSGKTITFSYYARAGANYSATSNALVANVLSGTGSDQNVASGYTGQAVSASATATLTTTWQRFTVSGTVASTATELALYFQFTPTGTASTNDYFEITGVQLEAANSVSNYAPNTSTYQAELAACQRYYHRQTASASNLYTTFGSGVVTTASFIYAMIQNPVTMRTAPSSIDFGNIAFSNFGLTSYPCNTATFTSNRSSNLASLITVGTTTIPGGMTAGQAGWLTSDNSATGYFGLNAEL